MRDRKVSVTRVYFGRESSFGELQRYGTSLCKSGRWPCSQEHNAWGSHIEILCALRANDLGEGYHGVKLMKLGGRAILLYTLYQTANGVLVRQRVNRNCNVNVHNFEARESIPDMITYTE